MRLFFDLFLSLRGRLIFLACLATFPALLFVVYLAEKEKNFAFQIMEEEARHLAILAAREHAYQLEGARAILRWLGAKLSREGHDSPTNGDPQFLTALLGGYPYMANIGVTTPDGEVIASAYPLPKFPTMKDNPAIKMAMNSNEVEVGNYIISPIIGRPVLNLALAVRNPDGSLFRIVFDAIDLLWLTNLAKRIEIPQDYILLIIDREGTILTHSGFQDEATFRIGAKIAGLTNLNETGGGKVLKPLDSAKFHFLFSRPMVGVPGVFVVSGLPFERIHSKVRQTYFRILGGLILLTFLTLLSVLVSAELSVLRSLRILSNAARGFGRGHLSERAIIPDSYGELKELATEFNNMANSLAVRHQELMVAHGRLRALSRHLQYARESEAKRISRELHDEIGQVLTSLQLDLADLRRKCQATDHSPEKMVALSEIFTALSRNIDGSIEFVRKISSELRPNILDKLGLVAAMEWQARELEKRMGLGVTTTISKIPEPVNWLVSIALFRIAREAFTNISRHSKAQNVTLELTGDDGGITLLIRDDGQGFSPGELSPTESLGIVGMQERANLVNGEFSLCSVPGTGTVLRVRIPNQPPMEINDAHLTGG